VLRPTVGVKVTSLRMSEVKLYGKDGSQIPRESMQLTMSSEGFEVEYVDSKTSPNVFYFETSYCNDGKTGLTESNYEFCQTDEGDLNPTLTVQYLCPGGRTPLAKVEVFDLYGPCGEGQGNCLTMDFKGSDGSTDLASVVVSAKSSTDYVLVFAC
jgi:hypothetical protein